MQKQLKERPVDKKSPVFNEPIHPVLQRLYAARGIKCLAEVATDLAVLEPFNQLSGVDKAISYLAEVLASKQRILIVGDFDADGATSTALAISALRAMGAQYVDYLVPNRFAFGYGLTPELVAEAVKLQPDVIITVDNGIANIDGVAAANAAGIKVIITDHHLQAEQLPEAYAIVNPNCKGDQFASKNLAGVGVIFYLMLALRRYLCEQNWFTEQVLPEPNMSQFLDLVALGTVADVVSLDQNNRILVQQGLKRIRAGKCRPGILALLRVAKRDRERLVAADLGYAIAPRLNAAGRLEDMAQGIECLLTPDENRALTLATRLDELNQERRSIEQEMQQQALAAIEQLHLDTKAKLPVGLCLYDESWHQGVIGIVAGRIKERLSRPVIAFAKGSDTELKGSARSIAGVHLRDVLAAIDLNHPGLIKKFGGHAMAAGLTLAIDNLPAFSDAFVTVLETLIKPEQLRGIIFTDGELSVDDFTLDLAHLLRSSIPWGQDFPPPVFVGEFAVLDQYIVGAKHLKLQLALDNAAKPLDAIYFNAGDAWPNHRCNKVQAAYRLEVNEFRGVQKLQLMIEYLAAL